MPVPGERYSSLVIDHFDRPRNVGHFPPADDVIAAAAGAPGQGAMFNLSAQIEHEEIKAVRFETYGCPHCIAAASWLSERLIGANMVGLMQWSWQEAAQMLDVPAEKRGRLLILEDAVRHLAEAWRQRG